MASVPLITGAYSSKSIISSAQRCINLYLENNPKDAKFPTTHYLTPGLDLKKTAPNKRFQGMYVASNDLLYVVVGGVVFKVDKSLSFKKLGVINDKLAIVKMVDNGFHLIIVNGSSSGYTVKLSDDEFKKIDQPAFYGGDNVQFCDGFFILNRPSTNQFYISTSNRAEFDPLDFNTKTGFSDLIVTLCVVKRYIFLFGASTTEIWYNAGVKKFPFARMPSAFMQVGCAAKNSVVQMDDSIYWLAQSPQGGLIVVKSVDYNAARISTHAMENEFFGYSKVDDAVGYAYQIGGHFFYVLIFPSADKTWVYDLSTQQWNEWLWTDDEGNFHRHRSNCGTFFNDMNLVGDWENGNLYQLNPNKFTDDGKPIVRVRSFPHMVDDGNRVLYSSFIADMAVGEGDNNQADPLLSLRWSDTRGASWGNAITASLGFNGDYLKSIQFQRLGMARDRVFELSWSANTRTALNGAFVNSKPLRK